MLFRSDDAYGFSQLDSQTLLLKLPSMGRNDRASTEAHIQKNKHLLDRMPYLIIDCRDNGGGINRTWTPLKPYLQTQSTVTDGQLFWGSEDNAEMMLATLKQYPLPKKEAKLVKQLAKEMKAHPGQFVGSMNARRERYGPPTLYPQKVVILVNGRCASSCEEFVLWAQQSRKVTIMGVPTAGIVDFVSTFSTTIPCMNWDFRYPMARSNRVADGRALDNIGIPPKISLQHVTTDWIEYAQNWLKANSTH